MSILLEVDSMTVAYRHIIAVREVSLTINKGEIVTVLGLNGAGKSSLLGAIVGRVKKRSGRVKFNSIDISKLSMVRIANLGISLVPEGRSLFSRMTVRENLRIAATTSRGRRSADNHWHNTIQRFPALEQLMDRPAGLLSGGEQQQLAVARGLLTEPELLILDEPSLGLSPTMTDRLFETIEDLRSDGRTILIVEQQVNRTLSIADRAYVMARGSVALEGTAKEVSEHEDLSSQYFGAN